MKNFFCSIGLSFCLVSSVFASDNAVDILNSEIINILAPFQNRNTVAQLKFDAAEINNEHAEKIALSGLYNKIGSKNSFELKINSLGYSYGDGKSPTTVFKASLGIDLTRFLTREESNAMVPRAIELLDETLMDSIKEYGDAVFIKGIVTSTNKDTDGNYTGLTALISAKIDLNKLPENLSRSSIIATDGFFSITLNLKTGIAIDSFIVSNREYTGFQEDQMGLKEILEHFLARDKEARDLIEGLFMYFDYLASDIVEIDNSSFWKLIPKKYSFKITSEPHLKTHIKGVNDDKST